MRITPERRRSYYAHAAESMRAAGLLNVAARYEALAAEAQTECKPSCRRCHRPLSAHDSVKREMGPDCWGRP